MIDWFRVAVDLQKNLFYEKVLFLTQLSYHLMCKLLKKILHVIYYLNPIAISRDFFFLLSKFECWNGKLENIITYNSRILIELQKCVGPIVQHLLSMRWKCSQLATLNVRVCHPQNVKQENHFHTQIIQLEMRKFPNVFQKI